MDEEIGNPIKTSRVHSVDDGAASRRREIVLCAFPWALEAPDGQAPRSCVRLAG
jgi:hypothetical protein